ncbi:hypothetical protein ES705_17434 [subsurface metagenome]|nr:hypothetical protein [Methanosarcinales archaeon]
MFGRMKREGFGLGVSKNKLANMMLDALSQLPPGTTNLKDCVVANLGLIGQMCTTRDINEAWNQAKGMAANEYPERFILDGRKVLHWNDGSVKVLDRSITTANYKKLNELAESVGCSVNELISRLIRNYRKGIK